MKQFLYILIVFLFTNISIYAQKYKTHKVQQGETIEQISKRYNVTPFDIFALNPDAKKGLKINSVLIIPKSKVNAPKTEIVKEFKGYRSHKVKRRETLFSLAKKYDVTQDEIKKHNTFLYSNNLRKGDRLKIPVFTKTLKVEEVNEATKLYLVKAKEGKWRIAYKYGISVDELEALNPNIGDTLKIGQEIKVPNIEANNERQIDEAYNYYTVLPREGFYRLKLKLGVDQEILEVLNPGLKESGLKVGMVLKTPKTPESNKIFNEQASNYNNINLRDSISDFSTKNLVFMLPFKLNSVDLDSIRDTKRQMQKDSRMRISLDFYSGALFALDSLKKLGISVNTNVYDTEDRLSEVSHILNTNDFENTDAVIGPLMSKNFEKAASELRQLNVPIVSPITQNVKLQDNVFQSRPSQELLEKMVINYVKKNSEDKNIVIISDAKNKAKSDRLKQKFISASQITSKKNKDGKDQYYVLLDDVAAALKQGDNIVILETKNEGFVSNVSSILNSLAQGDITKRDAKKINIILTTTNFNKAFQGDEVSNYHLSNLQFHYASISKPYDEEIVNPFVKQYENYYGVSPNNYAIRGFDLTMDIVLRLVTSEDLFMSTNNSYITQYLENKFAYKKKLFGGYYNDSAYLVKYDDLKIVEVSEE